MNNDSTAQEIADLTAKKFFAMIGVDADDPESVEEFRQDLRFGRRMRRASDHMFTVIYGAVALGIVYAIWDGIVSRISKMVGHS